MISLKQAHFQITRNCNLRCDFCGQWGRKGFFSDSAGKEMGLDDWKRIIEELKEEKPLITVWGGEPLVCEYFDEIVTFLKENCFKTEVITNGILIDRHADVIRNVDKLYISVDGTREVHDKIRGKGVYDKVKENIQSINHPNITVMSVITPELIDILPQFLEELEELKIKSLYLQDMIGLSRKEIREYKTWMKEAFDINAKNIDSWENNDFFGVKNIETKNHSYKIEHKKHNDNGYCKFPFNHAHIAWNGNVLYCTDFYDFYAGNVKEDTLKNILKNEKSEKFRQEIRKNNCTACKHCSWRNSFGGAT